MVELHLNKHCIETEAKIQYRRLLDQFFMNENPPADLPEMIETLRIFIEQGDFPSLRASDPRLCGMVESTVVLSRNGDRVDLRIDG